MKYAHGRLLIGLALLLFSAALVACGLDFDHYAALDSGSGALTVDASDDAVVPCSAPAMCYQRATSCSDMCTQNYQNCMRRCSNGNGTCTPLCSTTLQTCLDRCTMTCIECSQDAGCSAASGSCLDATNG